MTILEILEGTNKMILANIDLLAKDYLEKKGKQLNKSCPSCISEMVLTLKNYYNMTQFKFKRHAASYFNNKKVDITTISNSTMTDKKAVEFLKTNPKRIELFSEYPSNWKDLIEGKVETETEKETRLAIEAEIKEAKIKEAKKATPKIDTDTNKVIEEEMEAATNKPSRKVLEKMSLKELRAKYPDIKATSMRSFVKIVMAN